jgi:Cu(I)/Ag(I) efflux system membrane fusion protein
MLRFLFVGLLVVIALGAGALLEDRYGLLGRSGPTHLAVAKSEDALEHAIKHLDPDYVCPMHPQVVREGPGTCPICGMALIRREHDRGAGGGEHPLVQIAPEVTHNLGVRVAPAERRTLWRRIDTLGYVEYDRDKLRHVYASAEGSVVHLSVRSEGERVEKGQFLFELQSPRLSKWFGRVTAEQAGIVADLKVIEGTWALPTDIVMTIADLSSVWVLADIFEGQADWVREGQTAEVRLPSVAGKVWEGKVEYIYPNLDPETRTLKVRMRFDNPDETLKPNMLAEVAIFGGPRHDVLAIPREALIETGKQQRVVVAEGEGRFQPREVMVGVERGEWVEISQGLEEGEEVVVSGQFLIDSESSLQASLTRFEGPEDHEEHQQEQ